MELLLGLDIGTTGCKAALYESTGNCVGAGYRKHAMSTPQPSWVEEDPDEWWEKSAQAIREAISVAGANASDIRGVSVSGSNALIAMGSDGEVLCPAIMQLDLRTAALAQAMRQTIDARIVFELAGNRIAPSMFSGLSMCWLRENLPEVYQNTWKFLSPTGFLTYRLCGKAVMDYTRASTTLLFDIRRKRWARRLIDLFHLDENKLPDLTASDAVVGHVHEQAAKLTGLQVGTPVAGGCQDSVAAAVGCGCNQAGKALLILGTVARICIPLSSASFNEALLNVSFLDEPPYLSNGGTVSGGLSVRWALDTFTPHLKAEAKQRGVSAYALFDEWAARAPKGSDSLIYLPYLNGERAPIWDSNARGVFFGLTPRHDSRHFARATMEGVAYAVRQSVESINLREEDTRKAVLLSGGGANSLIWCQIFADVLGRPVAVTANSESETSGAAFIAGKAIGLFGSYQEAAAWSSITNTQYPDPAAASLYSKLFAVYEMLYPRLKDCYDSLASVGGTE